MSKKDPVAQKPEIVKLGVPAGSGSSLAENLPNEGSKTASTWWPATKNQDTGPPSPANSGGANSATNEIERFRPVPVVGKLAWRTQYRLIAAVLLIGVIALVFSIASLTRSAASTFAHSKSEMVVLQTMLELEKSLSISADDPQTAAASLSSGLLAGRSALSEWSGSQPAWMDQWSKIEASLRPFQSSLGKISASDARMQQAAKNGEQAISQLANSMRAIAPSQADPMASRGFLVFSALWVAASLALLVWVHWKQQRWQALSAQGESERIQNSILVLMEHLRAISQGDLTHRAPVSEDAVGTLADILNHAIDRLRALAREVKMTSEKTTAASQRATDSTGLLVDRSREDMASQVANGAEVLRLAEGVRRLTQLVAAVTSTATRTAEAVVSGSDAVASARSRISEIRELNEEAGSRVGRLALSSREIANIITIVNELADQAGVLADQAALQAARAGDAGKAFKIVANGMEDLAQQTGSAARKVGTLIEAAVGDIEAARTAMSGAVTGTDEISRLVDVSGDASRLAVERSDVLTHSMGELVMVINEQDRIAGVLDENTKLGLTRVEDGQSKAHQAAESVMTLIEAVRELGRSADRFRV
jgi:methyl-accepting chemotaxis protein